MRSVVRLGGAFALLAILSVFVVGSIGVAQDPFNVGMIVVSPAENAGWSYEHRVGAEEMAETLGDAVQLSFRDEPVPEANAEPVIRRMARDNDMVFTTSFGYMDPTLQAAKDFPDTLFEHASGFKTHENMGNYFGRIYQARYLTGLVAGATTETDKVGYVAAFPIAEVLRGINAFARGVQEVNPDATVRVIWTNTWFDPEGAEAEQARTLVEWGADVLTQHQDSPKVQEVAATNDLYSIGYHSPMGFANEQHLTAAVWNFGPLYTELVAQAIDGTWEAGSRWYGFETPVRGESIVEVAPLHEDVPADVGDLVETRQAEIADGTFDVFSGPIRDNEGNLIVGAGETLDDEALLSIDWLIEGVEGTAN